MSIHESDVTAAADLALEAYEGAAKNNRWRAARDALTQLMGYDPGLRDTADLLNVARARREQKARVVS